MSSPKHLWSGDWQRESEAALRERARRRPQEEETEAVEPAPASRPRLRLRLPRLSRTHARFAMVGALVGVLVVVAAYGLATLVGGSGGHGPSAAASPPWLGLQMESLSNGSVIVSSVVPGSPAAQAGVRTGDVITEVQSRPVGAPIDVTEAVDALRAGDTIEIKLLRGSDMYTARARLIRRPSSFP